MSFYNFAEWGYLSALALIACVPLSARVFAREAPTRAAMLVLLHAAMWLPAQASIDFPVVPALHRSSISMLCVIWLGYAHARRRMRAAGYGTVLDLLVFCGCIGIVGSVMTNQDPIRQGIVYLPGLTTYDTVSFILGDIMSYALPIVAGRAFIRSTDDLVAALRVMMVAGLIYCIPILYEIRMSPMLHVNVYGFQGHPNWFQNVRDGGFRATVFMGHGLFVAFFISVCTLATLTLRTSGVMRRYRGVPLTLLVAGLFGVGLLQKSVGATVYTVVGGLMIMLLPVKAQVRASAVLMAFVLLFPLLRITETFPTEDLLAFSEKHFGAERAQSLDFRFVNEDVLLTKVQQRPTFGWGGYSRERIYDPWSGRDLTVEDGMWIIVYASRGLWGFLTYFLLYAVPVFFLALRFKKIRGKRERKLLAGLAVMMAVFAINMLPNGDTSNYPLFFASGLHTLVTLLSRKPRRSPDTEPSEDYGEAPSPA